MTSGGADREGAGWLRGIWAATHTPFLADGEVDRTGIRRNARHYCDAIGLDGIFCNGLMGEGWALDSGERRLILDDLLDEIGGDIGVGVVVTHHSERETLDLARHAERSGAHHVVLMRPNAPLSDDEVLAHIQNVAAATDLPIILFEAGAHGRRFGERVIRASAERGAIAAVKAVQGIEAAARLRECCGGTITVTDPVEENWLTNFLRFDLGVLYADPEPYLFQRPGDHVIRRYFRAAEKRDIGQAWRIHSQLEAVRRVYNRWILWPLNNGFPPNAALKLWCETMGLAAGPVRSPLMALSREKSSMLKAELAAINIRGDIDKLETRA